MSGFAGQGMDTNTMCTIDPDLKKKVRSLRFNKSKMSQAIIIKIDKDADKIVLDEELEEVSPEELSEELPEHSPRFVVYSYEFKHNDGRISYPFVFIYYCPIGCNPQISMKYAGTKLLFVNECDMSKVYEIRDREVITTEWLREKISP